MASFTYTKKERNFFKHIIKVHSSCQLLQPRLQLVDFCSKDKVAFR